MALSPGRAAHGLPDPVHVPSAGKLILGSILQAAIGLAIFASSLRVALPVWQTPSTWIDLLALSLPGAIAAAAILVVAILSNAARTRRPLSLEAFAALLVLPYLLGMLLFLGTRPLPERVGLLIGFNEVVVLGVGLAMDHRLTRGWRLHAIIAIGSALAALTPLIADVGTMRGALEWPAISRLALVVTTAAASQAGLWAMTFFLTGILLDALRDRRPTQQFSIGHWGAGLTRGAIYGGVFMLVVQLAAALLARRDIVDALIAHPEIGGAIVGAILFPLGKTLLESFDGSRPFFARLVDAVREPRNYLRGAIAGATLGHLIAAGLPNASGSIRFARGAMVGALAYAGADLLWDLGEIIARRRRRLHSWRIYALGAALGGFVAGALGWYFDATQLAVVIAKFWTYAALSFDAAGKPASAYVVYPLFSKWGAVNLGVPGGGVKQLFSESLSGVLNWSLAAPLFGLNLVVLNAVFQRSAKPLRELFSGAGAAAMMEQTVRVLRWGLWMAPIIFSFLKLAPDPTWYNQDGAIRTVAATVLSWSLSPADFRSWSLTVFLGLLAYDWLRVLVWFDHMGLRVATLVNLSFVGGDALDEQAARFIGHSARTRSIPEGIRRFLTWAPLLIPFYLPRGAEWDQVWSGADALRQAGGAIPPSVIVLVYGYRAAALVISAIVIGFAIGALRRRSRRGVATPQALSVSNGLVTAELHPDGRGYSRVSSAVRKRYELDLTRRPDDPLQLRGKFFYLREIDERGQPRGALWSLGRAPLGVVGEEYAIARPTPSSLRIVNSHGGIRARADVELGAGTPIERWRIQFKNLESRSRRLELTSFQELALSGVDAYRRAPAFAAMHVGTWFVRPLNAVVYRNRLLRDAEPRFKLQRMSREVGYHCLKLSTNARLIAYEDSRSWFLGAGGERAPDAMTSHAMRSPDDEGLLYTFDPAASLRVHLELDAGGTAEVTFIDGYASDLPLALGDIAREIDAATVDAEAIAVALSRTRRIHVPPIAELPFRFSDDGTELHVTLATPRPWAHVLANPAGQGALIDNEGSMFSFAGNAQQNVLADAQSIYLVDLETGGIERAESASEVIYGRGYATFRRKLGELESELTCFVLHDKPVEVKLLRLRNRGAHPRKLRVVPYAQIVLGEVATDTAGRIETEREDDLLFFCNPKNDFRKGWAFAATSLDFDSHELSRARFVGSGRDLRRPHFAEHGSPDASAADDGRRVGAFAGVVEIPAGADVRITFLLGQVRERDEARKFVEACRDPTAAQRALIHVQHWWDDELSILRVETESPQFDRLINDWLPYQLRCSRLWGRTGPNQRGGAFGFRDQLQDVLPLVFVRPDLARAQILLHAAQQFVDGDVVKWWHPSAAGKTGIAVRTAASDPQLWLPYVVSRYIASTGDHALLDERVAFLEGAKVPRGQEGVMAAPRVSSESGSIYEHCRRAIEWSLARRGGQGAPLLGSGDWNDGIDVAGIDGRGESGWLGFFLYDVLIGFAPLAERSQGADARRRYLEAAETLRVALEGLRREDTYVRLISDDGAEMIGANALMAAWPALSGAVALERGLEVLESNLRQIEKDDRVLLSAESLGEHSRPYPGRLADYPPGVRENGGQYSHGSSWLIDAYLRCADLAENAGKRDVALRCRDRAAELWLKISPLTKLAPDKLGLYGLPPHQQPADVYHGPGYEGYGGWSWYTGAAARMLSAAYALLGLSMEAGKLKIADHAFERKGPLQLKRVEYRGETHQP